VFRGVAGSAESGMGDREKSPGIFADLYRALYSERSGMKSVLQRECEISKDFQTVAGEVLSVFIDLIVRFGDFRWHRNYQGICPCICCPMDIFGQW